MRSNAGYNAAPHMWSPSTTEAHDGERGVRNGNQAAKRQRVEETCIRWTQGRCENSADTCKYRHYHVGGGANVGAGKGKGDRGAKGGKVRGRVAAP